MKLELIKEKQRVNIQYELLLPTTSTRALLTRNIRKMQKLPKVWEIIELKLMMKVDPLMEVALSMKKIRKVND